MQGAVDVEYRNNCFTLTCLCHFQEFYNKRTLSEAVHKDSFRMAQSAIDVDYRSLVGTAHCLAASHVVCTTLALLQEFCNKGTLSEAVDKGLFRIAQSAIDVDYRSLVGTATDVAQAMCYLHRSVDLRKC